MDGVQRSLWTQLWISLWTTPRFGAQSVDKHVDGQPICAHLIGDTPPDLA
jgi:hypothetical protein